MTDPHDAASVSRRVVAARGRHAARLPDRLGPVRGRDRRRDRRGRRSAATSDVGGAACGCCCAAARASPTSALTMARKGALQRPDARQAGRGHPRRARRRAAGHRSSTAFGREVLLKYVGGEPSRSASAGSSTRCGRSASSENRALHDLAVKTHVVSHARRRRGRRSRSGPPVPVPAAGAADRAATSTPRTGSRPRSAPPCSAAQLPYTRGLARGRRADRPARAARRCAPTAPRGAVETPVATRRAAARRGRQLEAAGADRRAARAARRPAAHARSQLERYDGEMERMVVELDTVRANIVSVSASGDARNQERLAETRARAARRDERGRRGHGRRRTAEVRAEDEHAHVVVAAVALEQRVDEVGRPRRPGVRGSRRAGASRPTSIDSLRRSTSPSV